MADLIPEIEEQPIFNKSGDDPTTSHKHKGADSQRLSHDDLSDIDTIHLTAAQLTDLTDAGSTILHYHDTDRDSDNFTGTEWTDLTDAGDSILHYHSADRSSDNFTGDDWADLTDAGTTILHSHNHADLVNLLSNDHPQYMVTLTNGSIEASSDLIHSDDAEKTTTSGHPTYVKVKEIKLNENIYGTLTFKYDTKTQASGSCNAYLAWNGQLIEGATSNNTTTYATWSSNESSAWISGALFQIYADNAAAGYVSYVKNFRVYGRKNCSASVIGSMTLDTPIEGYRTVEIDFDNQDP